MNMDTLAPEVLARGFAEQADACVCLLCGQRFEHGEIFPVDGRLFESRRAAELHMRSAHPNRLAGLFELGGSALSLTDNQRRLLELFASGMSDQEVAGTQGVSPSTVRHQRFTFRERARSARLFLAAWQIAEEGKNNRAALLPVHKGATMVDERYEITEDEYQKILGNVFESLDPLRLKVFSSKEKKKIATLRRISEVFEPNKEYSEKEINETLKAIYPDFATLRRYLVEYGYMARTPDCKRYWRK